MVMVTMVTVAVGHTLLMKIRARKEPKIRNNRNF